MGQKSNSRKVLDVARALEELNDIVVYVGGSVVQFYSKDPAAQEMLTTYDVDCVIDITTYEEYNEFQSKLYAKKFSNDQSEGAPVCRFLHEDEIVDFMPKKYIPLTGESNTWYPYGLLHRIPYEVAPGTAVFIMPVSFYLASKFEALHSRGGSDYRGAKDFEDIIYVINSCPNVVQEILSINDGGVIEFLKKEFTQLVSRKHIREEIECSLTENDRMEYVLKTINDITCIKVYDTNT